LPRRPQLRLRASTLTTAGAAFLTLELRLPPLLPAELAPQLELALVLREFGPL
jgi:hypothetical protein